MIVALAVIAVAATSQVQQCDYLDTAVQSSDMCPSWKTAQLHMSCLISHSGISLMAVDNFTTPRHLLISVEVIYGDTAVQAEYMIMVVFFLHRWELKRCILHDAFRETMVLHCYHVRWDFLKLWWSFVSIMYPAATSDSCTLFILNLITVTLSTTTFQIINVKKTIV